GVRVAPLERSRPAGDRVRATALLARPHPSRLRAVPRTRAKPYHHGDLKAALIDGAVKLIAERGVRRFSLAELSRRLGVTVGAPYRHFADRDELLAAVAVRALE